MAESSQAQQAQMDDIVIRRILDAPIDLVWEAWTSADHLVRWWGPQYYTSPSCTLDLRVGGMYVFSMQAPETAGGLVTYSAGKYKKIVPKSHLEFTQYISDKQGNPLDPATAGLPPDFPKELRISLAFEPRHDLTKIVVTIQGWTSPQMFAFAVVGWHQQFDKLEDAL